MKKRLRAIYSGRVQGVGFRATVARLARHFPLEGAIWNRRDGRVELVVEGEQSAIAGLLDAIRDTHLAPWIDSVDVLWEEPTNQLRGFSISWEEDLHSGC
ncbi:acylphosphatase [Methylacidimicrobium cyclopophantes]|uniref:acylphosphatase n=1 Tax=Methylacidimicrobium cyclopophantes TaxID=1041766 RepID=A0A5E6M546_9BACT|nr:acylphosphatase [Methylacidimicrobium cyclopophantes]VVM04458.1 acylphosphatase [Methylacidimicrobium cyclopophantes]